MTLLTVTDITKRYGKNEVLSNIDLSVNDGEFVTLLGPSGCGKTTLLRIIAGFEAPTSGSVTLNGSDITRLPPHRRPVNTVFQRYLLFPHLDVAANVAFGLRIKRTPKKETKKLVMEALELVRLAHLVDRRGDQLSGGQAQRVSLARALVNKPRLLLLDEPLSSLDLKVRLDMQAELRRIHRETGATFLYVTHDQQEAMSLSDQVVVMRNGAVEQIDAPAALYHRPATAHVARFVGDANLLHVTRDGNGAPVFAGTTIPIPGEHPSVGDRELYVARPELISLSPLATSTGGRSSSTVTGTVTDVAFLGSIAEYRVSLGNQSIRAHHLGAGSETGLSIGDRVVLTFDAERCFLLVDDQAT